MVVVGLLLLVVSAISVIYPLRFLMIPNRLVAICGVVLSLAIIGSTAPTTPTTKTASASERKPAYTSTGGCKTNVNGDIKRSHAAAMSLFPSTSQQLSALQSVQTWWTTA